MIASLSIFPIGQGTSLGRFVKQGVKIIEDSGLPYEVAAMATNIETPDLDALFKLIKDIHAAQVAEGAERVVIDLRVDDRRDKPATMETKRRSVTTT